VNIDQLRDSLSGNDPNEGSVLGLVYKKRRAARQRMYAASGGLAVVVVAVLGGFLLRGVSLGGAAASSSSAAAAAAAPNAGASSAEGASGAAGPFLAPQATPGERSGFSGSGSSASCAGESLKGQLAMAVQQGASIIVGYGTASGTSTAGRVAGGLPYYEVTLRSVQTLAGPEIRSGSAAWVQGSTGTSSAGTSVTPEGQSLWVPGGELFGVVTPAGKGGTTPFTVLRAAPVTGGQVIFSLDECWNIAGLPGHMYFGPISPLPSPLNGSANNGGATAGVLPRSLYAVPLAEVEKLVPRG
jgi:hypothetical protein